MVESPAASVQSMARVVLELEVIVRYAVSAAIMLGGIAVTACVRGAVTITTRIGL